MVAFTLPTQLLIQRPKLTLLMASALALIAEGGTGTVILEKLDIKNINLPIEVRVSLAHFVLAVSHQEHQLITVSQGSICSHTVMP
jgi:hypothetical protein